MQVTGRLPLGMMVAIALCTLVFASNQAGYAQSTVTTVTVGAGPRGVAVHPGLNRVYVANNGANTLSVIDGATNTVINTVPVGTQPRGVAVLPALNRVYVANQGADTVSVLDATTGALVATIPVGDEPVGVAANPNTNFVYVTNAGANANTLMAINGATNGVVATIDTRRFPTGPAAPFSVAVNPVLNLVYVANFSENTVAVIDGATNTRLGTPQTVLNGPIGITAHPSTGFVYTANVGSSDLSVITSGGTPVGTIPLGFIPNDVAINPSTNRLFVAGGAGANGITFVNASTGQIEGGVSVPPGAGATQVAVNSTTNRIYVTLGNAAMVQVLQDGAQNATPTVTPTGTSTSTPTAPPTPNPAQLTQTAVANLQTATAIAATQTALVPPATQTAIVAGTQTAVANLTATAQVAATRTAVARATGTAAAALTQVAGLATPTATIILTPGTAPGPCGTRVGDVCLLNDDPANPGTLSGTAIKISSMTFNVTATTVVAPVAGSIPAIFLPTTVGVESFFAACTAAPAAAPFTVTCTGTTVGDILQGAVVTVRFANAAGGVSDVTGITVGPGPAGAPALPALPPPAPLGGQGGAPPPLAIPAGPRPPLQFIPAAPAPLLPPVSPLAQRSGAAPMLMEVPVIPEADSAALLALGLVGLGALALRRRRGAFLDRR